LLTKELAKIAKKVITFEIDSKVIPWQMNTWILELTGI